MLGRRKSRDGDGVLSNGSRRALSGTMGGVSGDSDGGGTSPTGDQTECPGDDHGDEEEGDEEEESRDILAVCKHGDRLGIAAVRENFSVLYSNSEHVRSYLLHIFVLGHLRTVATTSNSNSSHQLSERSVG